MIDHEHQPEPPADRHIRMWGECGSTGMWCSEGYPIQPEDLPIDETLMEALHAWALWYDEEEGRCDAPSPWEAQPGTPVAAYSAETRRLAHALAAALPAGWTILAFDVDSWRFRDDAGERAITLQSGAMSGTVE